MNPVQRFFRRYFLSTIGIILLFVILNFVLFMTILVAANHNSDTAGVSISGLASMVTENNGAIHSSSEVNDQLAESDAWAMLLNDGGTVIWSERMPEDLPRSYTATQIAKFSRWYLQDYPIYVWEHPSGLLVIGYPPNSVQKYSFSIETSFLQTYLGGIALEFAANMLLMLFLFWNNSRRIEKAMNPILTGIGAMAQGQPVRLETKGELAEIKAELNWAGQQLHKKDTARADWISGISHDVRTPLSIILGYASEIEDNHSLPPNIQTQASLIRRQGEKLRQLIIDLNLTSKLEYSMQPMKKTLLDPVELARQVISDFLNDGLDPQYSIELRTEPGTAHYLIEGDQALLVRMLNNLIGNSIRHNPDGCCITVSIGFRSGLCAFFIQDTGYIEKRLAEQLNNDTETVITQDEQGEIAHGNGLKLVRQIVKVHNGTIHFSVPKNSGLQVVIEIPVPE